MSQTENQNLISPLATKLAAPQLPLTLVNRERLLADLDVTPAHRLVLLSASAGFGKTTLLSAWVRQSKSRVAWLTLDEQDDDPIRFWAYVIAALGKASLPVGEAMLALLQAPQRLELTGALTSLINELAMLEQETILVFDDYHVIRERTIHESLQFLLDHLPPNLHLCIASRIDPPLALSRLRVRGQLVEIRDTDLRLSSEETATFLSQVMKLALSEEDMQRLETRTEGWIAGLQLAALSLRRHADVPAFIRAFTGSQRFILDYVQEEILMPLPELQQNFLLETAVLDRMNAAICQALTGREDAQQILEALERANLFLVPLDEERNWYRFHALFREVLLARLQAIQPRRALQLHRAAAVWYEQQGWLHEAISHALAARDFSFATSLLESNVERLYLQAELKTLLAWIQQLPEDVLCEHPRLATSYILTFNMMFPFAHQQLAERASLHQLMERLVQRADQETLAPQERDRLRNRITILKSWDLIAGALSDGNVEQLTSVVQQMQRLSLNDDIMWSLQHGGCLTIALRLAGNFPPMVVAIQELRTMSQTTQQLALEGQVLWGLVAALLALGQLRQARDHCQELGQLVDRLGRPLPVAAYPDFFQAQLAYEWNDLDMAKSAALKAIEQTTPLQYMDILMGAYEVLVRVCIVQGDLTGAEQAVRELERLHQSAEIPLFRPWIASVRVHLWLAQGKLAQAVDWAERAEHRQDVLAYPREREYLALVHVYLAKRQYPQALQWLNALLSSAEQVERTGSVIAILALQVAILQAAGNVQEARYVLQRLLMLAEPEGYVRVFLDAGKPMQQALQALLVAEQNDVPADHISYIHALLDVFASEQGQEVTEKTLPLTAKPLISTPSSLPEALTPREQEVLRLLAEGASNQEIARQLIVSLATAKKHVANILSKLGAENRTQAIAYARSLSLL
ncbi:LuxR family transcriptional regulator [Reticulibacter mediterranei]|uniref:LuxR family transcriptional regulator n=1 Tax=Reticulibacter mediterranei TaxID=2778369 RepID=A0A8J3N5Q2_9CHLR|nr:LuxR C-terminal-related transcriptional regulator [Reticulibacter mediterranei]GHO96728.1 LuxR family transcriptional regulator [Reticulibacter mediterranei]